MDEPLETMDQPRSAGSLELRWSRVALFPAVYRLLWQEQEIGELSWEGLFSSRAVAVAGNGAWRIRRRGFFGIAIEDANSGEPVGEMRLHAHGAELEFVDGRQFPFRRAGLFPPAWRFLDPAGSTLLQVRGYLGMLFRGGTCTIEPAGEALPETRLLALFAMYVLIHRARRRARH